MSDQRSTIVPVVLSGGAGTRLWPASREQQPKQLLSLVDARSMITATIDRLSSLDDVAPPIIVTNVRHAIPVDRALRAAGIERATLILEPVGRNTAPAVAIAAHEVLAGGSDGLMLVLPADHVIRDTDVFATAVDVAARAAQMGSLVTFGIAPTSPETGYGYIRAGEVLTGGVSSIAEFKEKPDAATAEAYLASGEYSWNSGMFLFLASRYLEELERHRPTIAAAVDDAYAASIRADGVVTIDESTFARCPSESLDFAVMEHTDRGAVLRTDPGWSDVGSWASLWEVVDKDALGNALRGDVVAIDTRGSYVSSSGRVVAIVGLDDVVVVDTPDALLVSSMDTCQEVKRVVEALRADGRNEVETTGTEYARWGVARLLASTPGHRTHLVWIDEGSGTPVEARPDATVHWQVLQGSGAISIGTDVTDIAPGDSVLVPAGVASGIENRGQQVLMLTRISVDNGVSPEDLEAFGAGEGPRP